MRMAPGLGHLWCIDTVLVKLELYLQAPQRIGLTEQGKPSVDPDQTFAIKG